MTKGIYHQAIRLLQKEGNLDHHSRIIEQLVAEIKRLRELHESTYQKADRQLDRVAKQRDDLQERLAAKDSLNNDLMANCNQLRDRCWKAESEMVRWQKIAIDKKLKYILERDGSYKFDLADTDHCPITCHDCEEDCSFEWCPSKDFWRSIAAKELDLQVAQEAGYLERLEKEFETLYLQTHWRKPDQSYEDQIQEAQAALEKIRKE